MPKVNNTYFKKLILTLFIALLGLNSLSTTAFAQRVPKPKKQEVKVEKPKPAPKKKVVKAPIVVPPAPKPKPQPPEKPDLFNLKPALWKITTPGTTVYFFGSVHVLPDNVHWVTPKIFKAFNASDTLILETDPNVDDSKMIPFFVQQNGLYPKNKTLKEVLPKGLYRTFSRKWAESGLPSGMKDGLKPWYASIVLTGQYLQTLNLKPENGVEHILTTRARRKGISIRGLETTFNQLNAFSGLSEKVQIDLLENSVSQLDNAGNIWKRIVEAWGSGHEGKMKVRMLDEMRKMPSLFEALVIRRNRNWIPTLQELLQEKGTHFVAVGAAHLVGDYSVLKMLRMKGYRAERVQ